MKTKLLASAVFAAMLATSPALQAQSLVGGATGSLRGATAIGPGGIAGQGAVGRLGTRETVGGVHRELRGTLAERRAELEEIRRQQRAERMAAEAAAEVESAASAQVGHPQDDAQDDTQQDAGSHEGRLLDDTGSLLVAGNGQAQGAGSLAGSATRPADDGQAGEESPAAERPEASRVHASGEANADADASASREGASVGASAAGRGEASVEG